MINKTFASVISTEPVVLSVTILCVCVCVREGERFGFTPDCWICFRYFTCLYRVCFCSFFLNLFSLAKSRVSFPSCWETWRRATLTHACVPERWGFSITQLWLKIYSQQVNKTVHRCMDLPVLQCVCTLYLLGPISGPDLWHAYCLCTSHAHSTDLERRGEIERNT